MLGMVTLGLGVVFLGGDAVPDDADSTATSRRPVWSVWCARRA
jgi:hypothetical protein